MNMDSLIPVFIIMAKETTHYKCMMTSVVDEIGSSSLRLCVPAAFCPPPHASKISGARGWRHVDLEIPSPICPHCTGSPLSILQQHCPYNWLTTNPFIKQPTADSCGTPHLTHAQTFVQVSERPTREGGSFYEDHFTRLEQALASVLYLPASRV
jgi:hypothetical protein